MQDFLNQIYFGNAVLDYIIFALVVVVSMVIVTVFKRFLLKYLKKWAERTETKMDDHLVRAVKHYLMPIIYYGVALLDLKLLILSDAWTTTTDVVGMVLAAVLGPLFATALILFFLTKYFEKQDKNISPVVLKWIGNLIKVLIWVIALLLLLDNLGVHITSLIAGLGVGGIAVAFAARAVLEDMFSSFAILFDKPFEVGDYIVVGNMMGTVEDIGLKTTRLRSLGGEQLVISNKDLTSSRIQNYKRMANRRVLFTLGVTYDTTLEKLKEIPSILESIIENAPNSTFDRAHFTTYADFSLNYEVVYYVLSGDYNQYMDIQQEINFKINEEFAKREIEFAFPTQTVHLNSDGGDQKNTAADRFE